MLFGMPVYAQITITTADMPSVGDTFRYSNGLITPLIDPVPTGTAYTWDFSSLQMVTQGIDTFVNVSSTGTIYSLVFSNLPFNPYRANLAAKGPVIPTLPQISVSDVNYFYYNTSASYEVSGYGATINGLQAPIPFNNKDRIYDFPVDFGNMDSSDSDFQLTIPGLGYYGHDQHRVNEADGWGTLITPFGSFNTLRVKSSISSNDSLYVDSLGTGFAFSLPPTTEYKWLGAQSGIPLLQITTTNTLGIEVVSAIVYQDSIRTLTALQDLQSFNNNSLHVYPNPSNGNFTVDVLSLNTIETNINLITTEGKLIIPLWSGSLNKGSNTIELSIPSGTISKGIYLLELNAGATKSHQVLIIND